LYDGEAQKADFLLIIKEVNPKFNNKYGTIKIQAFQIPISKAGINNMIPYPPICSSARLFVPVPTAGLPPMDLPPS
jgi:hypothetical protein